ncbi:hypothetical protein BDV12DRAFT_205342 [Aspergillus spectabilis]
MVRVYIAIRQAGFNKRFNKQISEHFNKQFNEQFNDPFNKQIDKHIDKQFNEQFNEQSRKGFDKQSRKQFNKELDKQSRKQLEEVRNYIHTSSRGPAGQTARLFDEQIGSQEDQVKQMYIISRRGRSYYMKQYNRQSRMVFAMVRVWIVAVCRGQ